MRRNTMFVSILNLKYLISYNVLENGAEIVFITIFLLRHLYFVITTASWGIFLPYCKDIDVLSH